MKRRVELSNRELNRCREMLERSVAVVFRLNDLSLRPALLVAPVLLGHLSALGFQVPVVHFLPVPGLVAHQPAEK